MAALLHTETWGDGGRRALLVHGVTSSAATMWEIGEGLAAAGWTAVAVDLPGHGGSGPAASHRFADVAATVTRQLGGGWDLVVAHSLGGAVTTLGLAGDPAFAARALLVDPALRVSDEVADGLVPALRRDQAGQTEALVVAANPHWHPRTVTERVRSTRVTDVAAVEAYVAQNRPWDVVANAREVRVPVHVLVPALDPVVTADQAAELSRTTTPGWTVETVPDTTHSLHRDRPALVVDRALRLAGD
jgi:pimeloyl-ACP methyl ester carboxylesterase